MNLPRIERAGVRRSAKSLLHLLAVVAVLTLSILTLQFLDDLQGRHQKERGDTAIDATLIQRLRADPKARALKAHEGAVALLKRDASFKNESELLEAIAREAAVITSRKDIDDLRTKLAAFDQKIPAATDSVLEASDKTRAAAVGQLAHLTQSRAAIAHLLRARSTEIEIIARDNIESLRPAVRSALSRRAPREGIVASLGRRLADNEHPMHLAYDVGFYTALVAAVLALAYLVWILVLRILPFTGAYGRVDDKIGDWLKREPSRRGNVGRAVASVAIAAVGAATVAEGIIRFDMSPYNEAAMLTAPALPPEAREPVDTRELAAELQKIGQSVTSLNQTVAQNGTEVRNAVGEVNRGVGTLSDNMRPLADAAPDINERVGRTADATARLEEIHRDVTAVARNTFAIVGTSATSAGHLGRIESEVGTMPAKIDTSVSNAAQVIGNEVAAAEQQITTAIKDRANEGAVRTAVHASHTTWRRLLWLEKYRATSAAIASLERVVENGDTEITDAVRSLEGHSAMYRTIFLDRVRQHIAAGNAANADALTRKYAPLILSLCRTAE